MDGFQRVESSQNTLQKHKGVFKVENKKKKNENKKEYEKNKFKYQNVCFKIEEMEDVDSFCAENQIARNTLIRKAVMEYIGKPFE